MQVSPFSPLLLVDAGVPMIFLTFPAMLALLTPIVLIEAWLCRKWLGLTVWAALKSNAAANVVSTLIGVPVAWGVTLLFQFFALGTILRIPAISRAADKWNSPLADVVLTILAPAWLGPSEKNLYWMVPLAAIVLLVPTFFLSVWIEAFVVDHMLRKPEGDPSNLTSSRIRTAVRNANLVSYGLLTLGAISWLLIVLVRGK